MAQDRPGLVAVSWQITSFALLTLALGGGMLWYERSRPPSRIVALVAVLAALAVAGRIVLAPIPNVVATTDIVLIAGYVLGPAAGFAVGAIGGLVSNFWLGQGAWTPWQMLGWGLAGIAGAVLWKLSSGKAGRLTLAAVCGLVGLAFGALMNLQTMVSYGGDMSLARYFALEVRAIPFDLAHMTGNIVFALIAGPSMIAALTRFRERFEWRRTAGPAGLTVMLLCLTLFAAGGATVPQEAGASSKQAKKAKQWLAGQVNTDGGYGREQGMPSSLGITLDAMTGFGRTGWNIDSVKSSQGKTPFTWLRKHKGKITKASGQGELIGNLAKSILALKAVKRNPSSLGGTDLVQKLVDALGKDPTGGDRVNTAAYAVMALRWTGAGKTEVTKTERWICSAQRSDGGWGISKAGLGDTDSTGAALLAVGGEKSNGRGIDFLKQQQRNNGGFINAGGTINSQATALAVQGMLAAGIDLDTVKKSGNSSIDFLRARQRKPGYIQLNGHSGNTDAIWVTAQVLPSLAKTPIRPGTSRDCADFVEKKADANNGGTTNPGGSGNTYNPGPGSISTPSTPGSPSGSSNPSSPKSGSGGNGNPGSTTGPSSSGPSGPPSTGTTIPEVPTVIPVVPTEALLAASAPGPSPSPLLAILICLIVSGGLCGGTVLLVRRLRW